MFFSDSYILNTVLFTPLLGALVILFIPREKAGMHRLVGNAFGLLGILVALPLIWKFNAGESAARFQFVSDHSWIPSIGVRYTLGLDGLSLLLVLLTVLLGAVAILSSWSAIRDREKEFYFLILVLQTGMLGVFLSLDFVLFYVFWEAMLVPMYFLIGLWGSERRVYAAIKFFLYTLAGSVVMLLAILAISYTRGTFDMRAILETPFGAGQFQIEKWLFWGFFVAFAVKVPMFPFHTWLPDAHTEAPTAASVLLAGVLLKMGTYGFLRISVPMFPHASASYRGCDGDPLANRDRLRRAGVPDAEGHEAADRVLVGEPHGAVHPGNFRADAAGNFRKHLAANQSRPRDWCTVFAGRNAVRAASHPADLRIRRPCQTPCRISQRST